jgi:RNA 2',3'-cyclic 3'-phosphodiesterase
VTGPDVRRLFLALWPTATVRSALVEVQHGFPPGMGRAVNADNLHITLVFLGSTPAERRDCIEAALAGIEVPSFTLSLDQLGYWRKPQVVWAGSDSVPAPLATLVDAVTTAAARCGCELDTRPFKPHLTLFRKVRKPPRDLPVMTPIPWPAESFVLVESITAASGVCYKVLKTWALSAGAEGSASG